MEPITINYFAVATGAVISMVVGYIWYGPIFGKKWLEIVGATSADLEERKKMQKAATPLYIIQFTLVLFQVLVLAHLVADTERVGGLTRSLWIWAAFVIPTLAGSAMWTNESGKKKWARFLLQAGYQLVIFIIFGALLQYWK
jgi:hypothetical protein